MFPPNVPSDSLLWVAGAPVVFLLANFDALERRGGSGHGRHGHAYRFAQALGVSMSLSSVSSAGLVVKHPCS